MDTKFEIKTFFRSANHIIVTVNILVFLLTDLILGSESAGRVVYGFALNHSRFFQNHEYYRIITCMFLHADISHITGNMLMIFMIGDTLERYFGHLKYLLLYFGTGILAGFSSMIYNILTSGDAYSLGASGAGFGIMGVLIALLLVNRGHLDGITLPRMLLYVALSFYTGLRSVGIDNAAHAGGLVAGVVLGIIMIMIGLRTRKEAAF